MVINEKIIKAGKKNQILDIIFSTKLTKTIVLQKESDLKYLVVAADSDIDLQFVLDGAFSNLDIYGLFLSKNKKKITGNIFTILSNNSTKAKLHLLSFMGDDSENRVEGRIDIVDGIDSANGHLLQEHIILGEKVRINTLPVLNVSSPNVSAGHGARVQRLDQDKMFYMNSKGLSTREAQKIIIQGYVDYVLTQFKLSDKKALNIHNLVLDYLLLG